MQYSLRAMFLGAAVLASSGAVAQKPALAQDGANGEQAAAIPFPSAARPEIPEQVAKREAAELPDAPLPTDWGSAGQSSSSLQNGAPQQDSSQSQHERAEREVKKQESQRAFGIIPSFNTSFTDDVVPLSKAQKISLAFHTSIDPFTFAEAFLIGGYRELGDNYSGYGWGVTGYGKRVGAAYADSFLGNMIGNGVLPGLLHQEPRYFRLGHGNFFHRVAYSALSAVRCKHDGTTRWEPNYSNVGGNIIAGAISNVYYPKDNRGWEHTFGDGMVNTATGIIGTVFQEFWYDIAQKLPKKK